MSLSLFFIRPTRVRVWLFDRRRARQILSNGLDIRIQQRRGKALVALDRHRIVDLPQIGARIGEAAQRDAFGQAWPAIGLDERAQHRLERDAVQRVAELRFRAC